MTWLPALLCDVHHSPLRLPAGENLVMCGRGCRLPVRSGVVRCGGLEVVDYQRSYPKLTAATLRAWAVLDTHDTLTDRYKHLRTAEQIAAALAACGMGRIEAAEAGNGVEARARRPLAGKDG